MRLNETHDPAHASWVESANAPHGDFPLQNLPFGVFRRSGSNEAFRGGVAIGDQVVDLAAACAVGVLSGDAAAAAAQETLNAFMAMGPAAWSALRLALSRALRRGAPAQEALERGLVPRAEAELALPAQIGDYTDFYTSVHHATAIGRQFRPDNPLLPNFKWIPIGYHGRASSIVVSGRGFRRPRGQTLPPGPPAPGAGPSTPVFGPAKRLDYELELGIFVGGGNRLGEPIPIGAAESHAFGIVLLNDWSARDIQAWEYQPLGPFLAKSFATTISPWIVTLDALAPYRVPWQRPPDEPQPLAYLDSPHNRDAGAFDIHLEVRLETETMERRGIAPARLAKSNFRHAYWTLAQLIAHHSVNGCNLRAGDLLGSGTLLAAQGAPA